MRSVRPALPWLLVWTLSAPPAPAADLQAEDVYLRVMASSVPVRTGPGGSYQEMGRVGMGQIYRAIDRSPDGAWYRIRLKRGVSGWVLSELVWPFEIVDESALNEASSWLTGSVLGKSQLDAGRFTFTLSGGALEADGLFVVRFGYQPSQHWLLEVSAAQSAGSLGSLLIYQAELVVMLGPWRSVVPFAAVGGGASTALPHREVELLGSGTHPLVSAGGGVLVAFQGAVTVRLDVRQMMVFTPDDTWGMLALLGGLMLTF